MSPSVSTRNFVGGLLGGSLGILLSWYFNPLALPFGVLLGVVIGWWHSEVIQSIRDTRQWASQQKDGVVQFTDQTIAQLGLICGLPSRFVRGCRAIMAKTMVSPVAWIASLCRQLHAYAKEHPTNYAHLIEISCVFLWGITSAALGAWLCQDIDKTTKPGSGITLGILLGILVGIIGATMPRLRAENNPLAEMRWWYREWEILSRYGAIGLFGYIMVRNLRHSLGFAVFASIVICWCIHFATLCIIGAYPTIVILGTAHGLHKLMCRTEHWLCLGVTLVITAASWLLFRKSFGDETTVWIVALVTGIVSGAATEAIRRPIITFYEDTKIGQWLLRPIGEHMDGANTEELEAGTGYTGNAIWLIFFWFTKNRLAQGLRTMCLGTSRA